MPKTEWTHQAHLIVGAWHVDRYGPDDAIARLRNGIRALNESHGTVNSDSSGYHETITCGYVRLIAGVLASATGTLPEGIARILGGPEGERDALLRYYSREALMSTRARAEWVEPDLNPLP